jgi:hypothetical protein
VGVTELVVLSPGTYHLKGSYKSDVASVRGLQWRIVCAGTANVIGESRPVTGSDPTWRKFDVAFTVPADNCPAQYVTLALDARSTSETFVSGSIWYDDLSITRDPDSE